MLFLDVFDYGIFSCSSMILISRVVFGHLFRRVQGQTEQLTRVMPLKVHSLSRMQVYSRSTWTNKSHHDCSDDGKMIFM